MKNRILVLDLNMVPEKYRTGSLEELENLYENKYGCKVLLVDRSKINDGGFGSPTVL